MRMTRVQSLELPTLSSEQRARSNPRIVECGPKCPHSLDLLQKQVMGPQSHNVATVRTQEQGGKSL